MPIELKMPALSPTMEEGTLAKWLVKEGDTVSSGDILAEIETDKATMEFEAVDEGTIAKILIAEGTDGVKVGAPIAILAGEGEDASARRWPRPRRTAAPSRSSLTQARRTKGRGSGRSRTPQPRCRSARQAATESRPARSRGGWRRRRASISRASRAAAPAGGSSVPIWALRLELRAQTAAPAPQAAPVEPGDIPHEVVKLSNMRKTIARRLTESKQQVPHIYLTVDIQLDALLKLRSELNAGLASRNIKLSVNDLLIKALAAALIEVPECNVSFGGDTLIKYSRADISVAVSIPGGLITPIVANANGKSVSAISAEMGDLAARAKEGKLQPHEYQGGTASISNMGMFGIKAFDAVINPPQAMIMAIGAGEKRPYVINDSLQIATVMSATGSFDHRAIDGADGARLMQAFKRLVENPLGMLA